MSSRNTKKTAPKAAPKTGRKRQESISSNTTFDYASANSFSDDYDAVDEIEDDDEDEADVTAVEEKAMLGEPSPASTFRPNDGEGDEANDGDDESDELSSIASEEEPWEGFSDQHENHSDHPEFERAMNEAIDYGRRVRFAVPPSDDSDSETEEDNVLMFPDLFVDQDVLDPGFRHSIENMDDNSSISDSFWDFEAPHVDFNEQPESMDELMMESPLPLPLANHGLMMEEDEIDYTSEGDTTEDEDYPDGPIKPPTTEPHEPEDSSDSEFEAPVRHSKDQPLTTAFSLNKRRRKPIAVYNTKTKKMMIFTQQDFNQSAQQPFAGSLIQPSSPLKNDVSLNPGTESLFNPSSATFGGGHDFNEFDIDSMFNQMSNPIGYDAMLSMDPTMDPFVDYNDNVVPSNAQADSSGSSPSSEDELDITTFLDFNGGTSDEDGANGPASTPVRPTTASSDLSHLHSSNVGAFRQNQVNARLIRNGATQDSIDFSGPYQNTVIKGIRSDRFDSAIAPLTPARRRKQSDARSPLDAASNKRKASVEAPSENGHKKQKSISTELTDLHM